MAKDTKQRLIEAGLNLLLERGYSGLGILAVLEATSTPKGSFYHHFRDKEDFALRVIDTYVGGVHEQLEDFLSDEAVAPLDRIRGYFEATTLAYESQGYMGCLMGGIGQELAATSEVFREKIEGCFAAIAERIAFCLAEAQRLNQVHPGVDVRAIADLLVDGWEGAALRSRLQRRPASLSAMLGFYFAALPAIPPPTS
jgi:TetR/AcrR family transcriptional repressor of nem operon